MADYGIKVSNTGYDVITATDKQLALSSKYTLFQADISYSFTLTLGEGGGTNTYDIAHGYGYVPLFMSQAAGRMLPENKSGATYGLEVKADATNIRFILTSSFSQSILVKCYTYRNKIE